MELVFTNCITYNKEDSEIGHICLAIRREFHVLYFIYFK